MNAVSSPQHPMGVAREFLDDQYDGGRKLTLRCHRGIFYRWLVTHWAEVDAKDIRGDLYHWLENADYVGADGALRPWHPTRPKVADVLEAMQAVCHLDSDTDIPCWIEQSSGTDNTVSVHNGLLDVGARSVSKHRPEFFNTHALDFRYDPDADPPPAWLDFLDELWGDDKESVATLQELMGYILAGGTDLQKMFLIVGPKRAGKGTIIRVLTGLLGRHNVAAPTLASLSQNFGLSPLIGKPLAAISDARLGARADNLIAVERLLSISGEDMITIDRKYRDPWTGALSTRFVILTNEIPRFNDASGALASRFVILTLRKSFYGQEDPGLSRRLLDQRPGIFNWALRGYDRLIARGYFEEPTTSKEAVRHLEDLASPIGAFIRDTCTIAVDLDVPKDDLWQAWKTWCTDEGITGPGTKAVFMRDLRAAVPSARPERRRHGTERTHVVAGLGLIQGGSGIPGVAATAAATRRTSDEDEPTINTAPATPDHTSENGVRSGRSEVKPTAHAPAPADTSTLAVHQPSTYVQPASRSSENDASEVFPPEIPEVLVLFELDGLVDESAATWEDV